MIHILLTILKVLGIILLVILCFLLALILIVLLTPIKYQVSGSKYEDIEAHVRIRWLFRLIEANGEFKDKKLTYYVRIAFFKILDSTKEKSSSEESSKNKKKKKDEKSSNESLIEDKHDKTEDKDFSEADTDSDISEDTEDSKEKESFVSKLSKALKKFKDNAYKIQGIPESVTNKANEIADKIEGLSKKKDHLLAIYNNEKNHAWIIKALFGLKKILIGILPDFDYLRLHFGTGDPASTGEALGMLAILYAKAEDRISVTPEFEEKIAEGEFKLHGHILFLPIVIFGIKTFLNRRFFHILKQLKRI